MRVPRGEVSVAFPHHCLCFCPGHDLTSLYPSRIPGTSSFPAPTRAGGRGGRGGRGSARDLGLNIRTVQVPQHPGTSRYPGSRWPASGIAASFSGSDTHSTTTTTTTGLSPGSTSWATAEPHQGSQMLIARPSLLELTLGASQCKLDSDPSQASLQVLTYRRAYPQMVLGAGSNDKKDEWTPEDELIPVFWPPSAQVKLHQPIGNMEDQFGHLPVTQTPLNRKLLRICKPFPASLSI